VSSAPLVILTREHDDNLALAGLLAQQGIEHLEYPCIATRLLPYAGGPLGNEKRIDDFAVIAFASRRAVAGMEPAAAELRKTPALIAAVGDATALALKEMSGRKTEIIAEPQTGEGLAKAILAKFPEPVPVLYVHGNKTTGEFHRLLLQKGFKVWDLVVYENFSPDLKALELNRAAIAVFASPSAARVFFAANSQFLESIACVAIGPTTRKALINLGVKNISIAEKPGVEELLKAIQCLTKIGGVE
jgi:uroporphyrinogen-III synthase